jgi:hypothetical protein
MLRLRSKSNLKVPRTGLTKRAPQCLIGDPFMPAKLLRASAFLIFFLSSRWAWAYEAYALIDNHCQSHAGFIINVDDGLVRLLNLDGRYEEVASNDVKTILVYNLVSNPISSIHLEPRLEGELRDITFGEGPNDHFRGWPIRFIDSLIMFYDEQGKTHVYELDSLRQIRPVTSQGERDLQTSSSVSQELDLQLSSWKCTHVKDAAGAGDRALVRPTRVLADEIKVQQFLQDYANGYLNFDSFQERTYLYARPYLYDREDGLGFIYMPNGMERNGNVPVFLKLSTGTPYRFQSFDVVGQDMNEFSPTGEPFPQIRSDLKAHLFHALLVGNLVSLAEGAPVFTGTSTGIDSSSTYSQYGGAESQVGLNYMTLVGADWESYSVSFGSFFPSVGLRSQNTYREILSNRVAYALRLMMTTESWRFRVIGAPLHSDGHLPDGTQLVVDQNSTVSDFSFNGSFVRAGADYRYKAFRFSGDVLWNRGDYSETNNGTPAQQTFDNRTLSLVIKDNLESTVSLTLIVNFDMFKTWSSLTGAANESDFTGLKYGGALEFLF